MGVTFRERMHGTFHVLGEPLVEHDIAVEIEAHLRDVRHGRASVVGRIRAEALGASDAPVQGSVGFGSLHERRIPYDLHFTGGEHLRLVGEKDLSWLAPVETLATLAFSIVRHGEEAWTEIARGTLRFDVRHDWRTLLRSVRLSPF